MCPALSLRNTGLSHQQELHLHWLVFMLLCILLWISAKDSVLLGLFFKLYLKALILLLAYKPVKNLVQTGFVLG
jgi:hypothetical protein